MKTLVRGRVYSIGVGGGVSNALMVYLGYIDNAERFMPLNEHPFAADSEDGTVGFMGEGMKNVHAPTKKQLMSLFRKEE